MPSNAGPDQDVDFRAVLHELLGMDEAAVDDLLETLDADELQALADAVAKRDKAAAQQIVGQAHSDADINALFRGEHVAVDDRRKKTRKPNDGTMQFAIGDDVVINMKGRDGKMHSVSATVAQPDGPEGSDTVIVKIKGKPTVIDKNDVDKLDENIIGMVGMPTLNRMQQLAGLPTGLPTPSAMPDQPEAPAADGDVAAPDALAQAMAAFDALEAVLPHVALADVKCVRERLTALQTSLNEAAPPSGSPLREMMARLKGGSRLLNEVAQVGRARKS